jgi:hypothetical protein
MRARLLVSVGLVLAAVMSLPVAARAGGALIVPPIRVDVGPRSLAQPTAGAASAGQIALGLSWASLWPRATPVDVGIGVLSVSIDESTDHRDRGMSGVADAAEVRARSAAPAVATACYGSYLELSGRVVEGRHWRAWLGGRGELLRARLPGTDPGGLGVAARLSIEIYAGGAGGDHGMAVSGTVAGGLYVEAGYRDLPGPLGGAGVSAGFSVRVPFILISG